MKKMIGFALILALAVSCMLPAAGAEEKKISVVTSIFPIYDWTREVIGENSHVQLTLLLDSGVDLHSYQPTAADIMKIASCDVFIYVGGESDEWVEDALQEAVNPGMIVVSLVEAMGGDIKMEETVEGMEHEHDGHEHHDEEHEHDHEGEGEEHDRHEEHDEEHEHEDEPDEHVWLSLRNAQKLVKAIASALGEADPKNAGSYEASDAAYTEKLALLDREYSEAVSGAAYHTVLFGDRFPFRYLVDEFGLKYYAAFAGCSAESEASFETIAFLSNKLSDLKSPAVFVTESSDKKIARTVVSSSSVNECKITTLDSLQSTTLKQALKGKNYLDTMRANLEALK